jgi:hypothetical protein
LYFSFLSPGNRRLHEAQSGKKVFAAAHVRGIDSAPAGSRSFVTQTAHIQKKIGNNASHIMTFMRAPFYCRFLLLHALKAQHSKSTCTASDFEFAGEKRLQRGFCWRQEPTAGWSINITCEQQQPLTLASNRGNALLDPAHSILSNASLPSFKASALPLQHCT